MQARNGEKFNPIAGEPIPDQRDFGNPWASEKDGMQWLSNRGSRFLGK